MNQKIDLEVAFENKLTKKKKKFSITIYWWQRK